MKTTPEEIQRWQANQDRKASQRTAKKEGGMEWEEVLRTVKDCLPETVPPLPYELTPEGKRMSDFKNICPEEFCQKIDPTQMPNTDAFGRITAWQGGYPGILAHGDTDTAKTRAAWSVLGRLYVKQGKSFTWFPVKRLIDEMSRYEKKDLASEFYKQLDFYDLVMVDDIDKINWQFDKAPEFLFQFYDWIYREHRPCITTTNKNREWWIEKMGEAFARRLFQDAHTAIDFTPTLA